MLHFPRKENISMLWKIYVSKYKYAMENIRFNMLWKIYVINVILSNNTCQRAS